ncbi:MAG: sigma-70 family RNA polymerase sigma factor [Xanthomonadales bacterium]|nr:sigma-70 family RNA polymerase sigma factor [Xanthomonadales bacterium]
MPTDLPTTRWSLIRASAEGNTDASRAWETLVAGYERAILAFFRRSGLRDEAEDLTQSFLAESIEGGWWARADEGRGSFRNFLYLLLKRFLAKRYRQLAAMPETGNQDDTLADRAGSAGRAYDLAFVLSLTRNAMEALREDYAGRDRRDLFDRLMPLISDPPEHGELQDVAETLGIRPNTLTVEMRRLRQRLSKCLQREVQELCTSDAQYEAEMKAIRALLADSDLSHLSRPG